MEIFEITYVEYLTGDIFGKVLSISALSPVFIIVGLTTLLAFSKFKKKYLFLLIGLFLNEISSKFIKNVLKQSRPPPLGYKFSSYGMPSSHTQFIFFFVAFLILCVINKKHLHFFKRLIFCSFLIGLAVFVSYSRIYHNYHTLSQVYVGAILGSLGGIGWFLVYSRFKEKKKRY
ncbi:hypothetical protein HZS_1274 [Henneguya salminicola]|nr:hypothetical protein HZS_1274 [Henneguya salminicola]